MEANLIGSDEGGWNSGGRGWRRAGCGCDGGRVGMGGRQLQDDFDNGRLSRLEDVAFVFTGNQAQTGQYQNNHDDCEG